MKLSNLLIVFLLFICFRTQAQEEDSAKTIYLEAVTINAHASMMPWWSTTRSLDVIKGENIQQPGTVSVEDALRSGSNVNIQSRGPFGVQTDISIRGSLFSQNLILINGVPFNDPQTAHHNFDIPIPTAQIERIEVLKGSGSAQYGANAFGGVVNIITKEPKESSGSIRLSGGEHGLFEGIGSLNTSSSSMRSANTLEIRRSDGYRYDTDFSTFNFTTNTNFDSPIGLYSFLGGYSKKTFGAFDFYSPGKNKPSKEWTETALLNLSTSFSNPSMLIVPRIFFRKHYDKFMYDIRIPDRYINVHTTQIAGGEIKGFFLSSKKLNFITGLEGNYNTITSSSLGSHAQSLFAAYASLHYFGENFFTSNIGIRGDFHSDYGTQVSPTLDLGYVFTRGKMFASVGRSFRAPNYTELYYSDPSTKGNRDLKPEIGWSYEVGYEYGTFWNFKFSLFERDQTNLIDYVRYLSTDTQSVAKNFTSAKTRGIDAGIYWFSESLEAETRNQTNISIHDIGFSYEYLDSHIDLGNIFSSRYAFTHPRHRISAHMSAIVPYSTDISLDAVHSIKFNSYNYTLLSARIAKHFKSIIMFVRGTNLLNQSYEEINGVPLPGRWLWAGIEFKVF